LSGRGVADARSSAALVPFASIAMRMAGVIDPEAGRFFRSSEFTLGKRLEQGNPHLGRSLDPVVVLSPDINTRDKSRIKASSPSRQESFSGTRNPNSHAGLRKMPKRVRFSLIARLAGMQNGFEQRYRLLDDS
jgi:hypothetical protein